MTTTPEPAVSPAPDTDALRNQLARAISEQWLDDESERGRTDYYSLTDAVLPIIAEREAGLRADLDGLRAALEHAQQTREEIGTIAANRGDDREALSELLRGMARRVGEVREEMRFATGHIGQWQKVAQRLRAQRDRARSAGARTIPDDAAERLTYALFRMSPGLFCDAPVAPINALTAALWKHVWRDLADHERAEWQAYGRTVLAQVLEATPTTGPAPAAADVQWLPATFVNTAGGVGCASCNGYQALGHDGECYPYGQGPTPDRLPPNTRIVAAPQAPAQPTELPSSLLAATLTNLGITQAELARRTGISTKHINFVIKGKAGLGPDVANALAEATGVPASRWNHAEANRRSGLAAREDTAPPDGRRPGDAFERFADPVRNNPERMGEIEAFLNEPLPKHETTIREDVNSVRSPGWYIADCNACDWTTSGSEPNVEVAAAEHEDQTDADRADNLIPARPAPPVDGDTPTAPTSEEA